MIKIGDSGDEALRERLERAENELREANETLDAIRNGEVDAVVVGGAAGQIVYTLENADRPYRTLVEQMKEGAVTTDGDGVILYCNPSFTALVQGRAEHIVGGSLFDHVEEPAVLRAMFADSPAGRSAELGLLRSGQAPTPVNLSIVELAGEDGAGRIYCGIVTDLGQNYARAREIAEAYRRLAAEIEERGRAEQSLGIALDAADMGTWDLDLAGDAVVRSARHNAIFGHQDAVAQWGLGETLDHFVAEDRPIVEAAFEAAKRTGRLEFEQRIRREGDGALRWIHVKGRTFYGPAGPERIAGVVVDITERRLIDEQLRQAQKMEAVGQLTGGIAHDFNNLLMIIGGSLQALARRLTLGEREQKLLDAAQLGVARGAKLNEQLLAFARRQDMQVEAICINDLLPDFETLLDRALGERVAVNIERGDGLWHCATDPHQLETAILNLAINARDAMGAGGSLTLATRNASVPARDAAAFEAAAGDYVVVSVADNGCGMAADLVTKVFEPFFTTKSVGKGTGLGLSQVYGFAKQSGGFAAIVSAPGAGTTVSIYLRRAVPAAPAPAPAPVAAPSTHKAQGVVLLVEDDADVSAAACAMLEELGYAVRQVGSGEAAIEALKHDREVDIVFSDVIMSSGMTGIELSRVLKAEWPGLPVLLTSGYTAQHLIAPAQSADSPLLRKPYTIDVLAESLKRATGG